MNTKTKILDSVGISQKINRLAWEVYENNLLEKEIIIVGEVGFLSKLYWLSIITYIGGGFSSGIHNIMEPAVASNPVIFGPKYHKFIEADMILKLGGGFCVSDSNSIEMTFKKLLSDKPLLEKSGKASLNLVLNNIGSSERIINGILWD